MKQLKLLIIMSLMIAIALLLSLFEIPLNDTVKFDLGDLVIMISVIILGYIPTLGVAFSRSFIRLWIKGFYPPSAIGETIGLIVSIILMTTVLVLIKFSQSSIIKRSIIYIPLTSITLTGGMLLLNTLFFTPIFYNLYQPVDGEFLFFYTQLIRDTHFPDIQTYISYCLITYIPINLAKSITFSLICSLGLNYFLTFKQSYIIKH